MFKTKLTSLALALALVSAPAFAQQTNPGVQQAGAVVANDCVKWGPGIGQISSAGSGCAAPVVAQALTRTNDTNVTLTLSGTPASALLQAVGMTVGWSGTLATSRGGLGQDASAQNGIALNTAGVISWLASSGTGNVARVNSPAFTTPNLGTPSAAVLTSATGLPIDGGTVNLLPITRMAAGVTAGDMVYWNGTAWVIFSGNNTGTRTLTQSSTGVPSWASAGTGTLTGVTGSGLAVSSGGSPTPNIDVAAASKAQQQAGSSAVVAVTPSQQQQHTSAAKAWVQCSAAGAVLSGYNVTSCTVGATGSYTVTFTTAFASAVYACVGVAAGSGGYITTGGGSRSTTAIGVTSLITASGAAVNNAFDLVCFGAQ